MAAFLGADFLLISARIHLSKVAHLRDATWASRGAVSKLTLATAGGSATELRDGWSARVMSVAALVPSDPQPEARS